VGKAGCAWLYNVHAGISVAAVAGRRGIETNQKVFHFEKTLLDIKRYYSYYFSLQVKPF
jgi:hypothetical protein